ncbi:MAG: superinfection immunity protein, partial [Gammaproteobacteria bacterium]|nr:superinfection immunity protein [Gammaproteobacteria bacterium]MBU2222522.1 superinfection immunity protein [Gammaproteobacteria bacterium]
TILAVFFNRRQLKLIALANVPAGMSFIAWGGCIVWAVTGNLWQKKAATPMDPQA